MLFVNLIIALMLACDLWWWSFADRAARRVGLGKPMRGVLGAFMGLTILGLLLLLAARWLGMTSMVMPEVAVVVMFVWHFLLLPVVTVPSIAAGLIGGIRRWMRPDPIDADGAPDPARRVFLTRVVVLGPPLATAALTARWAMQRDGLRVRRIELPLKDLPAPLEGLTIAHVSDPHIGSFMTDRKYQTIINLTNELDPDLILHGGDLINYSLTDLPDGIQMLRQMRSRYGIFSCEGNHDCMHNREIFERDTVRADIAMLLDQTHIFRVRGQKLQLIAPRWTGRTDDAIARSVQRLLPRRDPDAFAILMAHHPHAFDTAAAARIPLTLSGHTHGGQLQLANQLGFGPLFYRYWSGEYRKGDSACVVSNGAGNWFPLRINVPCEIIHLTLRRA